MTFFVIASIHQSRQKSDHKTENVSPSRKTYFLKLSLEKALRFKNLLDTMQLKISFDFRPDYREFL